MSLFPNNSLYWINYSWEMLHSRMVLKTSERFQLYFAVPFPTTHTHARAHTHTHTPSSSLTGPLIATLKISCCNNTVLYYPLSTKCSLYAWYCVQSLRILSHTILFYRWGNWGPNFITKQVNVLPITGLLSVEWFPGLHSISTLQNTTFC